jgi:hypothetical protein
VRQGRTDRRGTSPGRNTKSRYRRGNLGVRCVRGNVRALSIGCGQAIPLSHRGLSMIHIFRHSQRSPGSESYERRAGRLTQSRSLRAPCGGAEHRTHGLSTEAQSSHLRRIGRNPHRVPCQGSGDRRPRNNGHSECLLYEVLRDTIHDKPRGSPSSAF